MNQLIHPLGAALAAWSEGVTARSLLDPAIKCTALLLAGFAISAALRRLSAAHRSLAWLAVFAALLVLPLALHTTPVWTVPVVTIKQSLPSRIAPLPSSDPFEPKSPLPVKAAVEIAGSARWSRGQVLATCYLAGVALVQACRAMGGLLLRGVRQRARAADSRTNDFVTRMRGKLGIRRRIRVLCSETVAVPMTWGIFKPVLVLPAEAAQWTDADLRAALEHEMAHIRRHDAACRWLATLVCALWWPQPLVWLAARAWRLEQERACDDAVVRSGADPARYASQLIGAARAARHGAFRTAAALVMAMPSGLEGRLRSVMSASVNHSDAGPAAGTMCGAAAILAVMACALCQAEQAGAPPQEGKVIHVVTKFIEVANAVEAVREFPALREAKDGTPVTMSDAKLQELLRGLSQRKGVDLMSAPSVTTKAGQKAAAEVVREFVFPTEFSEEDGHLVPVTFELMPLGVITEVTPALLPDGRIALNAATATVNEFQGFLVVTKEQLQPADKLRLKFNDAKPVEGRRVLVAEGIAPKAPLSETMRKLNLDVKKGEVAKPIFHTRQWSGDPILKPGEWQIAVLAPKNPAELGDKRVAWFAISAKVADAAPPKDLPKDTPLRLEAEFIEAAEDPASSIVMGTETTTEAASTGVLTSARADALKKNLAAKPGTKVLAAPRLVTLSGRKGVVEVGSEISYPSAFSADGKAVEKTERKRIGISLEATPVLAVGGAIDLTLNPSVTELLGWQLAGRDDLVGEEPKGQGTYSPRFRSRSLNTSVSVLPGQPVVISLGKSKEGKFTFCLVKCEPADAGAERGAVTVFGQVRRQGKYEHKDGMTLKDLLDLAQGAMEKAAEIEIISGEGESKKTHRMTRPWDTTRVLQANDTVIVR